MQAFNENEVEGLDGLRVLVVEDDADTRDLVADLLGRRNGTIATAANAAEALTLLETFHPDVIVSDIQMPECDGYQLMRMVRLRAPTAAVALTGKSDAVEADALLAGFAAHIAKPFETAKLVSTIRRVAIAS